METDGIGSSVKIIIQIVLYATLILCGLLCSIPVGMTKSDFEGQCIMNAGLKDGTGDLKLIDFGPASSCNYVIGIHVFGILYASAMAALHIYALYIKSRQRKLEFIDSFIFTVATLGINAFTSFLCFVAACVITVGLNSFCGALKDNYEAIDDCSSFQELLPWHNVDGSSFHKNYTLAIVVCWLATVLWLALTAISALTLWRDLKSGKSLGRSPPEMTNTTNTTNSTTEQPTSTISTAESYKY